MKTSDLARRPWPWGWWLAAAAGLLALALNAASFRAAWSDNLAYLRLDARLNQAGHPVTLQTPGAVQDWPPAGAPTRFVAAYGLGLTELSQAQYLPAVAAFQAALAAFPGFSGTHALLADAYHGSGDDTQAVAEWRAAQALPLVMSRGEMQARLGNWQGAVAWYLLATQVDPQSAAAFWQLGLAYGSAGQRPAQIQALRTAAALAPNDAQIQHALGLAYYQQGALADAAAQFERVLALNPNDFYTNLYLAGVELGLGHLDLAEAYARKSTQLAPSDPRTFFALGTVLARRQQWPPAIDALQTALRLVEPWNRQSTLRLSQADQAGYHLLLAQTYQSAGQPALAVAEYQAVLKLDPHNAAASAALKTLPAAGIP